MLKKSALRFAVIATAALITVGMAAGVAARSALSSQQSPRQKSVRQISCLVVGVSDGDTITCLPENRKPLKIRLQEIDAPEKAQPFGKQSRQTLANFVHKRRITVKVSGYDRYQRALGTLYYQGHNINLLMVRQGMAWAYERYLENPAYRYAQQQAQAKRLGLWADKHPIEPEQWRQQRKSQRKNHEF